MVGEQSGPLQEAKEKMHMKRLIFYLQTIYNDPLPINTSIHIELGFVDR